MTNGEVGVEAGPYELPHGGGGDHWEGDGTGHGGGDGGAGGVVSSVLSGLVGVVVTLVVGWVMLAGRYVTDDELRALLAEERRTIWQTFDRLERNGGMAASDLRTLGDKLAQLQVAQGRTEEKIDAIAVRLGSYGR